MRNLYITPDSEVLVDRVVAALSKTGKYNYALQDTTIATDSGNSRYVHISDEEFDTLDNKKNFFTKYNYGWYRFGIPYVSLSQDMWNIMPLDIEGVLTGIVNSDIDSESILINIDDNAQDFDLHEKVLKPFEVEPNYLSINGRKVKYFNIPKDDFAALNASSGDDIVRYFEENIF